MKEKTLNTATILLSLVLYALSLTQTAYCSGSCTSGIGALLLGPLGLMAEVGDLLTYLLNAITGNNAKLTNPVGATFIWLANPLWLLALIFFVINKKASFVISTAALLTMLAFLACGNVINSNESGNYSAIINIGRGYWLWVLSAVVIVLASVVGVRFNKYNTL